MEGGAIGYRKYHQGAYRVLQSFLRGGALSLVSRGGAGIALKCVKKGKTPYVNVENGKPVNTVLIKLGLIEKEGESEPSTLTVGGVPYQFSPLTEKAFSNEVEIQLGILRQTLQICPSILTTAILSAAEVNALFSTHLVESHLPVSLIAMEMLDDVVSMQGVTDPRYLAMARAKFLTLGMMGINHGDLHRNNVLLSWERDKVYLIDFGRAEALDAEQTQRIKDSVAAEDYVQGLRTLLMTADFTKEVTVSSKNKNLKLGEARRWANTPEVNRAIAALVKRQHFLTYYVNYFGWVFSDDALNLTQEAKAAITEQLRKLKRERKRRTFGRHYLGESFSSFGSSISSANGGRTRRKRRTS
jgi:tRNA A-37 threonylcarbamoyl transferase component Bud32